MKARLYLLLSLLVLCVAFALFYLTFDGKWREYASQRALEQLTTAVRTADSIVVDRLASEAKSPSDEVYFTKRYPEKYFITGSTTLEGARAKAVCEVLERLTYITSGGAMCHAPGYLLDFRKDGRSLLKTSLCLHCQNLELSPLPFTAVWVSVFDEARKTSVTLDELQRLLE